MRIPFIFCQVVPDCAHVANVRRFASFNAKRGGVAVFSINSVHIFNVKQKIWFGLGFIGLAYFGRGLHGFSFGGLKDAATRSASVPPKVGLLQGGAA